MRHCFYVAIIGGKIDRKIRITQGDLTLAFRQGGLCGYTDEDDVQIYFVDLDNITVTPVSIADIRKRMAENDIKRKEVKKRAKRKQIEMEIQKLQKQL